MSFQSALVQLLADENVSDVHIQLNGPVWIRQAGDMIQYPDLIAYTQDVYNWLRFRYQNDDPVEVIKKRHGQDDFATSFGDLRVRGHCYLSQSNLNIALRRLSTEIPVLENLGLPDSVRAMTNTESGLVLVVGATGSGKSTTLAAMVNEINIREARHIVTLENPIEFVHEDKKSRIRQRYVDEEGDCLSFDLGVIAAMREDPDIIQVGEIRDLATVKAAFSAAQTGHLVLGTLHTNSAVETVERLLAFFTEQDRTLAGSVLSSVLKGVVAQRLVKTIDRKRALAAEIMLVTKAIAANIKKGEINQIMQSMESGSTDGQITMNRSLLALYESSKISREAALFSSNNPASLEKAMGL